MSKKSAQNETPTRVVIKDTTEHSGFKANIRNALDSHVDNVYSVFFKHLPRAEKHFRKKVERHPIFLEFRAFKRKSKLLYLLVISAAIILYWRGLWQLYDLIFEAILPTHSYSSAFISIFLGLIILIGARQTLDKMF